MSRYTDWQQDVLSNQEASLANQETMIEQNRVSQMINAAGFYTVGRKLDGVNRSVGEVRDAIQEMQQRIDVQFTAMNSTLRRVEDSISHYGEIATHQGYAQWRATPEGTFFHYTYRPDAQRLLLQYQSLSMIWTDLVLRAVKQEVDAFPSWKKDEWHSDALTTGVYYDRPVLPPAPATPPQLEALKQPLPTPKPEHPLKYFIAGLVLFFLSGLPGIVLSGLPGFVAPTLGLLLSLLLPLMSLFVIPVLLFKVRRRRREDKSRRLAEIEAENHRRRDYVEGFNAHVERWKTYSNGLLASWENANTDAMGEAHRMLCERIGVDLSADFSDFWALPADTVRVRKIAATLASATERPPARDELPELSPLRVNPQIEHRYGSSLRTGLAQLSKGDSSS